MDKPEDIAIIEIKESDEIYTEVEFLNLDLNFKNRGYSICKDADIFSIEHPGGNDASCASGQIKDIYKNEFEHDIPTDNGSSGCPILLLNNNINLIGVIGIHKEGDYLRKLNEGTFIGEILNKELKDDIKKYKKIKEDKEIKDITENKEIKEIKDIKDIKDKKEIQEYKKNNYIISKIYIKDEDINKDIRIIDSYEEYVRRNKWTIRDENKNENEMKQCEIKINNGLIPFNYVYKFKLKGKYIIKYIFKNNIRKACLYV